MSSPWVRIDDVPQATRPTIRGQLSGVRVVTLEQGPRPAAPDIP